MLKPAAIVKTTGIGLSYQDLGRPGWARYGVAPAGAMDKHAFATANQLLSNHPNAPCLEIAMGCVTLQFLTDIWISLTGAARCEQVQRWSARKVKEGETVTIQPVKHGIWSYLAISGGFSTSKIFGSTSRHDRSNLGQAITKGSKLLWDAIPDPYPGIAARYMDSSEITDYSEPTPIRVFPGPHDIPANIQDTFYQEKWIISNQADRTGFRLEGPSLVHTPSIHSLPILPGTIQLPPSGQPIVTMNDGPTCGGYPILGIIHPDDLSLFAQSAPMTTARFKPF